MVVRRYQSDVVVVIDDVDVTKDIEWVEIEDLGDGRARVVISSDSGQLLDDENYWQ